MRGSGSVQSHANKTMLVVEKEGVRVCVRARVSWCVNVGYVDYMFGGGNGSGCIPGV